MPFEVMLRRNLSVKNLSSKLLTLKHNGTAVVVGYVTRRSYPASVPFL
jgi:hypothetical protein